MVLTARVPFLRFCSILVTHHSSLAGLLLGAITFNAAALLDVFLGRDAILGSVARIEATLREILGPEFRDLGHKR